MYDIFVELLRRTGKKPIDVSRATGIPSSTFSDWKKGKSTPKQDKLQKIADYFGVSIEYLMTGEEKESDTPYYLNEETREIAQTIFENPDMKSLFDMSRKMSPERLRAHLEFMKKLQEEENR